MKTKLPALQFYVGDWRKDPAVQSLDYYHRGIWFEMLCIMHESNERGVLLLNGKPMSEKSLSILLGIDQKTLNNVLFELENIGIFSRRFKDNAIFCRRMVQDQKLIDIRRKAGKMGGNPNLLKQNSSKNQNEDNQTINQIPTPSISSSISSSSSITLLNKKKEKKEKKLKCFFSDSVYGNDKEKFVADWNQTQTAKSFPNVSGEAVFDYLKLKGDEYKYTDWMSAAQVWVKRSPNSNEWKQSNQINQTNLPDEYNTQANRRIAEALSRNISALGSEESKS